MTRYQREVAALSLGQIVCWASLYFAFTAFVLPMQASLGWSKPLIMGAFTLGLTVWGLGAIPVGMAVDRGWGRYVLAGGAAMGGVAFLLWSVVSSPLMLYATCCVLGVAMAMTLYEPAFALVTRRFPTRYRDGITTLTLVGGFSTTLSFPATAWLLQWLGWRGALAVIGGTLLFVLAPMQALAVRGADHATEPGRREGAGSAAANADLDPGLADAMRTRAFWLLVVTLAGYAFAAAAFWAHVVPALAHKGIDEARALAVLVWVGPTQVASRVVLTFLNRHFSARQIGFVVYAMQALAFLTFALASHEVALIAFAMLFGAASGLAAVVRGSLVAEYFGGKALGRIGGALSSLGIYARAAAPVSAAALLAWPMSYDQLMLLLAGISFVTLVAYAGARDPVFTKPEESAGTTLR